MITKSTIPTHDYHLPYHRVAISHQALNERAIATIAGVSQQRGVDLVMSFYDSIDIPKFKIYLDNLRDKYFFDDICIWMDGFTVHRSNIIKERMDELGFVWIQNPGYSPDYNPIKAVFSIYKNKLKRARMKAIYHE